MNNAPQWTVWLADDGADQRMFYQRFLSRAGYQVRLFENGALLMEALGEEQRPVNLMVVTDGKMPEMNGQEVVQAVHARDPAIPILYHSSNYDAVRAADLQGMGANHVMLKTSDHVMFLDAVSQAIQNAGREPASGRIPGPHAFRQAGEPSMKRGGLT